VENRQRWSTGCEADAARTRNGQQQAGLTDTGKMGDPYCYSERRSQFGIPNPYLPLLCSPLLFDHSDMTASFYVDEAADHPAGANSSH